MKKLLALLMAATMLFTLCACGKKTEQAPDPSPVTQLAETFLEAYYLRDMATQFSLCCYDARGQWVDEVLEDHETEEAFCAEAQRQADEKGIDVTVDSFDSYFAAYHQFILEDCREMYGEYTLTVKATESVKMEADLLPQFRNNLLTGPAKDYMDAAMLDAITEVYTVSVNIRIDGEKKTYDETYLVYVVYYDDKWQVINYST